MIAHCWYELTWFLQPKVNMVVAYDLVLNKTTEIIVITRLPFITVAPYESHTVVICAKRLYRLTKISNVWITNDLWMEYTGDRWILFTNGQQCGKRFDVMMSSLNKLQLRELASWTNIGISVTGSPCGDYIYFNEMSWLYSCFQHRLYLL